MDSKYSVTQSYKHLNIKERIILEIYRNEGLSLTIIAQKLGRNKSTISRELKRNAVTQRNTNLTEHMVYYSDTSQLLYNKRRKNTGAKIKILKCSNAIDYIEKQILREKWSPDAAVGKYKLDHPGEICVSTKTIYNYIDKGLIGIKPIDLLLKVKLKSKNHRIRTNKKKLGDSIENRPALINERIDEGHWEIDTVVSGLCKSSTLLTLTERKTRMEIMIKIPSRTSESVQAALLRLQKSYSNKFNLCFKSITCDNGSEFSFDHEFKEKLGVPLFYAHPYSSFERGTNENHNGIIRRFIPKGKSIDDLSDDAIQRIACWMNDLPRRILSYSTPSELFTKYLLSVA